MTFACMNNKEVIIMNLMWVLIITNYGTLPSYRNGGCGKVHVTFLK